MVGKREIICPSLHCHHQNDSYIRRGHIKDYYGLGTQDGHLDIHTAPELSAGQFQAGLFFTASFIVVLYVRINHRAY